MSDERTTRSKSTTAVPRISAAIRCRKYLCIHQYAKRYPAPSRPVNRCQTGVVTVGCDSPLRAPLACRRRLAGGLRVVIRVPQCHPGKRNRVAAIDESCQRLLEGVLSRVVERVA